MVYFKWLLPFIVVLYSVAIANFTLGYLTPDFSVGYLKDKADIFNSYFVIGFYAHIATSSIALVLATIQVFLDKIKLFVKYHRIIGYIYVSIVLTIAAPGAFIMSFHAPGGALGIISFLILTVAWWSVTFFSLIYGRRRQLTRHKQFATRSYLIALSALVLRAISAIFLVVLGWSTVGHYIAIVWLSWVPSLIFYEIYLRIKSLNSTTI